MYVPMNRRVGVRRVRREEGRATKASGNCGILDSTELVYLGFGGGEGMLDAMEGGREHWVVDGRRGQGAGGGVDIGLSVHDGGRRE